MSVKEQVDNLLWGFLYNWVYDATARQILNERLAQLIKTTRQEERNHMQYEEQHYQDGKLEVKLSLGAPPAHRGVDGIPQWS